jgi:hypothetical protein
VLPVVTKFGVNAVSEPDGITKNPDWPPAAVAFALYPIQNPVPVAPDELELLPPEELELLELLELLEDEDVDPPDDELDDEELELEPTPEPPPELELLLELELELLLELELELELLLELELELLLELELELLLELELELLLELELELLDEEEEPELPPPPDEPPHPPSTIANSNAPTSGPLLSMRLPERVTRIADGPFVMSSGITPGPHVCGLCAHSAIAHAHRVNSASPISAS